MIQLKRHVEDNVFGTFFRDTTIVGRLFMTAHPTIPFEVFAYKEYVYGPDTIDSKRVQSEAEAAQFVEDFQNKVVSYTHLKNPRADGKSNSIDLGLCVNSLTGVYHTLSTEDTVETLSEKDFDPFPICPDCLRQLNILRQQTS